MTQEDKVLLLKDLCARLPYGTMTYLQNSIDAFDSELCTLVLEHVINDEYVVKPYLFPLSSMTEEQKVIYGDLCDKVLYNSKGLISSDVMEYVNWCYKNHIDINNLIPMGLAIDATGLNIY